MRGARRGTAVLLGLLALSVAARGRATPAEPATAGYGSAAERTKLVLRIEGTLGRERESALAALLGSELAANHVTLHVERSTEPRLGWTATARRDPAALVLAILDVRDERAWALYVVDAARGRAILRRLPGGMVANAAALEEVSAILASAVAAVREGLEVASKPVEAVVSDQADPVPPAARESATPSGVTAPPAVKAPRESERQRGEHRPHAGTRPFGAVLARGSTLAGGFVPGVAAELGTGLGERLRVLVHGALDRSTRVSSELGAFEVGRTFAALEAGYSWPVGPVALEPRVGSGVEVIRRTGTAAAPGVVGEPGTTHPRFAAVAGVRARYTLAGPLALELGADATYAPRRIRFTSGDTVLASASPLSVGGLAGLTVGLP